MLWLRLIRWQNLVIVFLTQLLAWWCVVLPGCNWLSQPHLLNIVNFLCLSLSTVLIAAAGYIINDYFDIKIDAINRPEKVVFGEMIPGKMAIVYHTVLNIVALLLAAYVARQAHHYEWLLWQLGCTLLLWFYSTNFKRQFVTGNVVVAFLTAFTLILLVVYEPGLHTYLHEPAFLETSLASLFPNPIWHIGMYAFFAFMLTWMREIVKDIEDYKGDEQEGCITMPIKWGLQRTVRFTQVLGVIAMIGIALACLNLFASGHYIMTCYVLIALIVPLFLWTIKLDNKATTEHYAKASRQLKIIMVLGIGSLLIYYFETWLN